MSARDASAPALLRPSPRAALAAVLAVFVVLAFLRLDESPVGASTDDAVYVEMARSLAEGRGPVLQVGPGNDGANPDIFPPGFPLLLAPLAALFPASLTAFKAVPLLAALLLAPLTLRLARPSGSPFLPVAAGALVLLNPWVLGWSVRVLSDLPYAALSLAALAAYEGWRRDATPVRTFVLCVLAGLALLVRSVGLALVLAMLVDLAAGRRWRHAALLAGGVVLTQAPLLLPGWSGGTWLTAAYHQQMLAHHGGFQARLAFLGAQAWGYLRELPTVLTPLFGAPVRAAVERTGAGGFYDVAMVLLGMLLLAGVLRGLARLSGGGEEGRGRARLWLLYLGFYGLALVNFDGWPSGVQARLLLPVLPLLYVLLLRGLDTGSGAARAALVFCAVALAASGLNNAWRVVHAVRVAGGAERAPWADPGAGAEWILTHTGPDDVIATVDPLQRHVHFRRPAVALPDGDGATAPGARWVLLAPPLHAPPGSFPHDTAARLQALQASPSAVLRRTEPDHAVWIFELQPRPEAD